jgi:hypothetical protein
MLDRYTRLGIFLGFVFLVFGSLLQVAAVTLDSPDMPDAPQAVPGSLVQGTHSGIRIVSHRGEWTSFYSMSGGAEPILLINGQVENTSDKPLSYVKLQFELLGEDGVVVFRDYGYNRKAEELREEVYEKGQRPITDATIEKIEAAAKDEFRFIFFKEDIPEFQSYRIRVLEIQ